MRHCLLTLTWSSCWTQKMTDNAHLRLVTPLTVKLFGKFDLSFDDLDDVVASFVEPITARFRDVVEHERFIDGTKDVVEVLLIQGPRVRGQHDNIFY